MAITDEIYIGQDTTFQITIKDELGVVIDLDTASEIIVRLLDEGGNTIDKYNKAGGGGFRALDIATPSTGVMDVHANSLETDVANINTTISAEIKMRFTDADFDSSTFDSVTTVENLGIIRASKTILDL